MSNNQQLELLVRDDKTGHEVVPESYLFQMGSMSLSVSPEMPDNQFFALGLQIAKTSRSIQFMIGDWLIEAHRRGEKCYEHAGLIFGMELSTLKKCYTVAMNVPPHRRRCELSFDHHETVAKIKEGEEQEKWLTVAEKEHLSGRELRVSVKTGSVVRFTTTTVPTERDAAQTGPLAAISAMSQAIANAKREYGEDISRWPADKVAQWDRFLFPILAFGAEIRKAVRR